MSKKKIVQGFKVLEKMLEGAQKAASVIVSTMGPGGQLVCVAKNHKLRLSKDGATVAQNIDDLEHEVESIGVKFITQASKDMSERVGDGSTTVVCLLYAMMKTSVDLMRSGYSTNEIINAIKQFRTHVHTVIESINKTINVNDDKLTQIATIATNGDHKLGTMIANMLKKLGPDCAIISEESLNNETYTDIKEGFYFNKGVAAGFFRLEEQERMKVELDSPLILIIDQKLTGINPLIPIMQHTVNLGKSLLIVVDDVDDDVINMLAFNRNIGKINAFVVKADGFGDRKHTFLEDVAIFTGAKLVSEANNNFNNMSLDVLGTARKIQITKENTTIIGGNGSEDQKKSRISVIRNQIETTESSYDKTKLEERLSKLSSGIGTIYVGGQTELEIKESKDRVEDAIHACKQALKRGVVTGAGTELMYAGFKLHHNNDVIMRKLSQVLEAPVRQIVNNVHIVSADIIVEELKKHFEKNAHEMGFNGSNGKVENIMNLGIINPTSVSEVGMDIATTNCIAFIQTNAVILDIKDQSQKSELPDSDIY